MKVIFTSETKEDFRKHNDYVRKQKKSDGHKYQSYLIKKILGIIYKLKSLQKSKNPANYKESAQIPKPY